MNCAEISWFSSGLLISLNVRITADIFLDILNGNILAMFTILLPESAIFQDNNTAVYTAKIVKSWFDEHYNVIKHIP